MKKQLLIVSLVFLFCLGLADQRSGQETTGGPEKLNTKADVAAIKALVDKWIQLYNARSFNRLMSEFYVKNPVVMEPNVPAHEGREAILRMYRKDDELNLEHVETSVFQDVRVFGNLAVAWGRDTGTTTPRASGKPTPYDLKWLMAFERQNDGSWRCLYEMWNENPLPEAPGKEQK
jgi:ketosteroid isomerase-like protein